MMTPDERDLDQIRYRRMKPQRGGFMYRLWIKVQEAWRLSLDVENAR